MNNEKNSYLRKHLYPNFQLLTHQSPFGGLSDFKNECVKNIFIHFNLENVIETSGDSLNLGTSVEITSFC